MNALDAEAVVRLHFGDHNVVHVRTQFIRVLDDGDQQVAPLRLQPGDGRVPPTHVPIECFNILLNAGRELGPRRDPDQHHKGLRPQPAPDLVDRLRGACGGQVERHARRQPEDQVRRLRIGHVITGMRCADHLVADVEHRALALRRALPMCAFAAEGLDMVELI
jgi:hypothetical protein